MKREVLAFTLVELLVVVTIIVVLLALLVPAMDKAIYQAELATCGARLKGIAAGVTGYATQFNRAYPHRQGVRLDGGWQPVIFLQNGHDDRILLRPYIPINNFLDPLCAKVDMENTPGSTIVFGGYNMWFGFGYFGKLGMTRLGSRIQWDDREFDLLAGDYDIVQDGGFAVGSHPDDERLMTNVPNQTEGNKTYSQWGGTARGKIDMNFAYEDGSVRRLDRMKMSPAEDDRLYRLPYTSNAAASTTTLGTHVPR